MYCIQQWTEYFAHLCHNEEDKLHVIGELEEDNVMEDIVAGEVEEALQWLGSRKSPGPDGISIKLIKCCSWSLNNLLVTHINKVTECKQIPIEWRTSFLIPIFKKINTKRIWGLKRKSYKAISNLTELDEEQQISELEKIMYCYIFISWQSCLLYTSRCV